MTLHVFDKCFKESEEQDGLFYLKSITQYRIEDIMNNRRINVIPHPENKNSECISICVGYALHNMHKKENITL